MNTCSQDESSCSFSSSSFRIDLFILKWSWITVCSYFEINAKWVDQFYDWWGVTKPPAAPGSAVLMNKGDFSLCLKDAWCKQGHHFFGQRMVRVSSEGDTKGSEEPSWMIFCNCRKQPQGGAATQLFPFYWLHVPPDLSKSTSNWTSGNMMVTILDVC